jgi:hypothetical protein
MTESSKETEGKASGPNPTKPDFGSAPAEQQRNREAAARQTEADKREELDKKNQAETKKRAEEQSDKTKGGKDVVGPGGVRWEPNDGSKVPENPAALQQMEAEYGELDRSFSDGVEVEPEIKGVDREKKKDSRPRSTTVRKAS